MAAIQFSNLLATPASVGKSAAERGFYLDGDYSQAQPCGAPVPTFPFLNQGDTETVYFRQKYEQAAASYKPLPLTTGMPGVAGAYPLGDVNFRDGEAGIWEFERTYGNIPKQRIRRGQSHKYAFQYVLSSGVKISGAGTDDLSYEGPTYTLGTTPIEVDSTLIYDYFLDGQQSQFPLLNAPLLLQLGTTIGPRGVDYNGGSAFPLTILDSWTVAAGGVTTMLAEDDAYADWMGAIKCRVRRIIAAPTLAFYANSTS